MSHGSARYKSAIISETVRDRAIVLMGN